MTLFRNFPELTHIDGFLFIVIIIVLVQPLSLRRPKRRPLRQQAVTAVTLLSAPIFAGLQSAAVFRCSSAIKRKPFLSLPAVDCLPTAAVCGGAAIPEALQ